MAIRARGRLGAWLWMVVGALSLLSACTEDQREDPSADAPLAHDIDVALVELNQGVGITLAQAGEWIAPDDRGAPIVAGRDAVVRVYWTLDAEFEPRPITARLIIERPGVESIVHEQTVTIAGEPTPARLDASFAFDVDGDALVPGVRFSVSLHEVDASEPEPDVAPIFPRDGGTELIGVRPERTQMELVLVPMVLQWSGCSTAVDASEVEALFDDAAFMLSPTQALTTRVHAPLLIDSEPASAVDLLDPLQSLRADDGADTRAYYYGLYEPCGALVNDLEGVAPIAVADPGAGWLRVGVGILGADVQHSAAVFVHQLGHLHGLGHVDCPGVDAIDPDPDYPYADGLIGVWGLGLRDRALRDPSVAHDYMSNCYVGSWSSDWTWAKTFERIATVSSWTDSEAGVERTLLLGWIDGDGRERWWSTRGRIPAQVLAPLVAVDEARGEVLPAAEFRIPDAEGTLIGIELPDRVPDSIELVGSTIEVPSAALERARQETKR